MTEMCSTNVFDLLIEALKFTGRYKDNDLLVDIYKGLKIRMDN